MAAIAALMVFGLVGIGAAAAIADDDDDDLSGGVPIVVTVRTSVPTPRPSTTSTPTPKPTSRPTSTPSRSASSAPVTVTTPAPSPTPDGELTTLPFEDLGGVLYVSGLSTRYVPSFDPSAGDLVVHFTVRNVSDTTVDSYATFGLENLWGQPLSEVGPVMILRLEPQETRVVRATLSNPGQWALENASFTITPTSLVDGERVPSMTRESFVFFVPWLVVVVLSFLLAAIAVIRWVRYRQAVPVEEFG